MEPEPEKLSSGNDVELEGETVACGESTSGTRRRRGRPPGRGHRKFRGWRQAKSRTKRPGPRKDTEVPTNNPTPSTPVVGVPSASTSGFRPTKRRANPEPEHAEVGPESLAPTVREMPSAAHVSPSKRRRLVEEFDSDVDIPEPDNNGEMMRNPPEDQLLSPIRPSTPTFTSTSDPSRATFIANSVKRTEDSLPQVAEKLADADLLGSIAAFFELVKEGKYPLNNIALQLFCDTVDLHSLSSTTSMRYPIQSMNFWKCGTLLFGGRFPLFMGGPKHRGQVVLGESSRGKYDPLQGSINFTVPDKKTLSRFLPSNIPSEISPGIIHQNLDLIGDSDRRNVPHVLCCDGKSVASGLDEKGGDVDLYGFEAKPTLKERKARLAIELQIMKDMYELFEKSDFELDRVIAAGSLHSVVEKIKGCILTLSNRIKDLRFITLELNRNLKKYMSSVGSGDWLDTRYKFSISETKVMLNKIRIAIAQGLDQIKRMCQGCANAQDAEHSFGQADIVDRQHLLNMSFLKPTSEIAADSSPRKQSQFIKQRSVEWHNIRKRMAVTGSALYGALGLDSLAVLNEIYNASFHNVERPAFTPEVQTRVDHGVMHEDDALATVAMRALPCFSPGSVYCEEGIYLHFPKADNFTTIGISPDGSVRTYDPTDASFGDAKAGVEVKCPFPNDFSTPVHYTLPERYVAQCLAEMVALETEYLFYASWSNESTTIFRLEFDNELWQEIIDGIMVHFDADDPHRPKKLPLNTADLKNKLKAYAKSSKCTFLAEVPSMKVRGRDCDVDAKGITSASAEEKSTTRRTAPKFTRNFGKINYSRLWTEAQNFISDSYELSRLQAKEIFACMLSEMNRAYHHEIPHSVVAAYGLKGYSMTAAQARNLIDDLLKACHERGIRVPAVSFDGQWTSLIVRGRQGKPCTILQVMKDTWAEARKTTRHRILAILKDAGIDAQALVTTDVNGNYVTSLDVFSRDGAVAKIRSPKDPSCWETKTVRRLREQAQGTPEPALSLEHVPQDEFMEELVEVIIETEVQSSIDFTDPGLPDLQADENVHEDLIKLRDYLELEEPQLLDKWLDYNGGVFSSTIRDVDILKLLKVDELNKVLDGLRALKLHKESFKKSWKKTMKINYIHRALGGQQPVEIETSSQRGQYTVMKELKALAYSVVERLPKAVLNVAMAQLTVLDNKDSWLKEKRESIPMKVDEIEVDDTVREYDWYYLPEYDHGRGELEICAYDSHHLLVNLRAKINRDGLPLWGLHKEAWYEVSETRPDILSPAISKYVIDRQSASYARQCFSKPVEDVLRENGRTAEANFCEVIREWYEAEDKPGVRASVRFQARCRLKDYFLQHLNIVHDFPPPGGNIKGMSTIMFEGFLTSVEGHLLLYGSCPNGYNQRSVGSQDVENFFSELTEAEQTRLGCPKATSIRRLISKAVTLLQYRVNASERTFHVMTKVKTVYPVKPLVNMPERLRERRRMPAIVDISIRDHFFDSQERYRTKPQHKKSTIHDPRRQTLGARGVRQYHSRDDTHILAHVRAGIDKSTLECPF